MTDKFKFFIILAIFLALSLKYSSLARKGVSNVTNEAVSAYLVSVSSIKNSFSEHFNQKANIQNLREENKKLKHSHMLMQAYKDKLDDILKANKKIPSNINVELVEALSYEQISNYERVWISMNDFNASKIYGLIKNDSTAGIVTQKDGKPLALLQGDKHCVFSVSIGRDALPGVATGKGEYIHVKYIPLWMNPQVGDKVVTSGLDKIFATGISVGSVIEVKKGESYKTAVVRPNTKAKTPDFFYVIK